MTCVEFKVIVRDPRFAQPTANGGRRIGQCDAGPLSGDNAMSTLNIKAIGDRFGAQITACDVRTDINATTFPALAHALYDHRVIVMRAQENAGRMSRK